MNALTQEQVGTDFMTIHAGAKTNYHYVLWYGDERTILVKHEPYPYALSDIGNPTWIYLSSLGENSLELHHAIEKYLTDHPETKLAFQPGTFQMKFGVEKLAGIYRRSEIFFCNKEESQRILGTSENDVKKLLAGMRALGPKIVVLTDGKDGAYASDGTLNLFMSAYPDPKPPVQRTGAGDAFSSTVTVGLCLGLDLPTVLRWGPINSMSVVQQVGARAGLLTREKLEEYLANAPSDYRVKEI